MNIRNYKKGAIYRGRMIEMLEDGCIMILKYLFMETSDMIYVDSIWKF